MKRDECDLFEIIKERECEDLNLINWYEMKWFIRF